jgi:hypothetical protein
MNRCCAGSCGVFKAAMREKMSLLGGLAISSLTEEFGSRMALAGFRHPNLHRTLMFQIPSFFFCSLPRSSRRSSFEDYFKSNSLRDTGRIAGYSS